MNLEQLPDNLPTPKDDGASDHLAELKFPDSGFTATNGELVQPATLDGMTVLYIYPMTGRPDTPLPDDWDTIPGARGCTPQSCSFRDHTTELQQLNARVFGLSSQTSDYQREAQQRLHLPFQLLSDPSLSLKSTLQLPTFTTSGMELYRRITLIISRGTIVNVFYPVFPPGDNARNVVRWLQSHSRSSG